MCAASTHRAAKLASAKTNLAPRYEPPTLEDALYAAEGLTDDPEQQIVLAAELIHLPEDEVRAAAAKLRRVSANRLTITAPRRNSGMGAVVVEMRSSRRPLSLQPKRLGF